MPVLLLLVGCRGASQSPATATQGISPAGLTATPAARTSTPASPGPAASPTPTDPGATLSPCERTDCYGLQPPKATILPTPTSSLGLDAADLKGITLQFWYLAQEGDAVGYLPAFVSEFNKTNTWGIQVQIQAFDSPGVLSEQVRANLYSGNLPDVLAGFSYQVTSWDKNDTTLADLKAYLQDPLWGLSEQDQADFYPALWAQPNPGTQTKRLSVPLHRTAVGLYYNTTWAKELGFISPPTTPQEFEEQACAAARAVGDAGTGWLVAPDSNSLVGWMYAHSGLLVRQESAASGPNAASPRYQVDTPENLEALTFLKGLQTQRCAHVSISLYPQVEFSQRKALFVTSSTTGLPGQEDAFAAAASRDTWTVLPFPAAAIEAAPVVVVHGPDVMIPASTPEQQLAAWLFVRWLISPEVQSRWVRADGSCPLRGATLAALSDYAAAHPQWAALTGEMGNARSEPAFASWEVVRWIVADATAQLFSENFKPEAIPELLQLLETIANEAQVQVR